MYVRRKKIKGMFSFLSLCASLLVKGYSTCLRHFPWSFKIFCRLKLSLKGTNASIVWEGENLMCIMWTESEKEHAEDIVFMARLPC